MTESIIGTSTAAVGKAPAMRVAASHTGSFVPRLLTGLAIVLVWEIVVRAFAPAYVAKPSTVVLAIPRVIVDPTFLQALGQTRSEERRVGKECRL